MLTRETAPHLGSHMLGAAARGRPRVVVAGAISALYVAIAVAGVLRGDATTAAALLLCGVITSAMLLPWAAGAQLATVVVALTTLGMPLVSVPDSLAMLGGFRGVTLAVGFAASIAIAYVHARHRQVRTHLAAVLAGQTEILERITRGAPLDTILTALVDMVERQADGMLCSVLLLHGNVLRYGVAPRLPAAYREATHGILERITRGAPLDTILTALVDMVERQADGMLCSVLLLHGNVLRYGVAIERDRSEEALASSRRLLEQESHMAHALVQAGQVMLAARTTPVVLEQLARLTTELLGCDCADTVARADGEESYVTRSANGYAEHEWESLQRLRMPPGMVESLLRTLAERPVIQIRSRDVDDSDARAMLDAYGITTSLYVALRRDEQPIGFLSAAYRGRDERFTEQQRRIAVGIAQLASMALANAQLVEEARRASQLKTEFVSTMSHELRTPLSVIIGYTDMLVDHSASTEQAAILAKIRTASVELLEMIEMTLNVNRLEAGHDVPHFERLSVRAVFDQLAEEFSALPRHDGVVLRWEPAPVAIHSDRRKLRIVLKNLVGNALKFTSRGDVVVRCEVRNDMCAVSVEDTGVGIAPEQVPVIFDMFRQGDSSDNRSHGGIGLGLYIVRRLLSQLGGDVTVTSERARGSTFTITVPLAPPEDLRASA